MTLSRTLFHPIMSERADARGKSVVLCCATPGPSSDIPDPPHARRLPRAATHGPPCAVVIPSSSKPLSTPLYCHGNEQRRRRGMIQHQIKLLTDKVKELWAVRKNEVANVTARLQVWSGLPALRGSQFPHFSVGEVQYGCNHGGL